MTTIGKEISASPWPLWFPRQRTRDIWHGYAHARLSRAFETAETVPFDDTSRMVFFSDLHRGDNGRTDAFAPNEALFLHALRDYYQKGFTYVEVGDGDELWQHRRFQDIRRAHSNVFDLMHRFHRHDRLHILVGNHDIQKNQHPPTTKDNLPVREGLILCHAQCR